VSEVERIVECIENCKPRLPRLGDVQLPSFFGLFNPKSKTCSRFRSGCPVARFGWFCIFSFLLFPFNFCRTWCSGAGIIGTCVCGDKSPIKSNFVRFLANGRRSKIAAVPCRLCAKRSPCAGLGMPWLSLFGKLRGDFATVFRQTVKVRPGSQTPESQNSGVVACGLISPVNGRKVRFDRFGASAPLLVLVEWPFHVPPGGPTEGPKSKVQCQRPQIKNRVGPSCDSVIESHEKGLVNDIIIKKMSEEHLKNSVTTNYIYENIPWLCYSCAK
jgi:hypothetical protein